MAKIVFALPSLPRLIIDDHCLGRISYIDFNVSMSGAVIMDKVQVYATREEVRELNSTPPAWVEFVGKDLRKIKVP